MVGSVGQNGGSLMLTAARVGGGADAAALMPALGAGAPSEFIVERGGSASWQQNRGSNHVEVTNVQLFI